MSCRTRSGSSAAITIARMLSGLDDQQTISVFHRLSHAYETNGHEGPTEVPDATREHVVRRLREQMATIPELTDARRRSLLRRINEMESGAESYTVAEIMAIAGLVHTANSVSDNLSARIVEAANRAGVSVDAVRQYAEETVASVRDAGRGAGPSRRERLGNGAIPDLPTDRGTAVALDHLNRVNLSWRCESCGRFRNPDMPHVCPDAATPAPPAPSRARRPRAQRPTAAPRPPRVTTSEPPTRSTARQRYEEERARRQAAWEATERSSWSTDEGGMDLFQAAYSAARERKANGEPAVPLDLDSPGIPGRKFGLEIEFNLLNRSAGVKDRIMSRMKEAGVLEPNAHWERYHGPSRQRRANGEEVFSIESDCTVDGELITPPLEDTPENWRKVATICQILKEEGAITTAHGANQPPGGHIHVSLGDFDHGVESHDSILQTWGEHNDTLWRLSSRHDGAHRDTRYCNPNNVHYGPHSDVESIRRDNSGHYTTINFESVTGGRGDHVEFRAWDETLDPGTIQAQARLSLGITEAALRDPTPADTPVDQVGSHLQEYRSRRLSGEEWRGATRPVRNLVDRIFADDRHKEQIASLFATTRWQRGR